MSHRCVWRRASAGAARARPVARMHRWLAARATRIPGYPWSAVTRVPGCPVGTETRAPEHARRAVPPDPGWCPGAVAWAHGCPARWAVWTRRRSRCAAGDARVPRGWARGWSARWAAWWSARPWPAAGRLPRCRPLTVARTRCSSPRAARPPVTAHAGGSPRTFRVPAEPERRAPGHRRTAAPRGGAGGTGSRPRGARGGVGPDGSGRRAPEVSAYAAPTAPKTRPTRAFVVAGRCPLLVSPRMAHP